MPIPTTRFSATSVREDWDAAADAWSEGQSSGRDYYRLDFFGPAHIALCGDVGGLRLLDVGCGSGYFAREMAKLGARVTAVDISPRMLAHAQRIEAAAPLGIRYIEADAARLCEHVAREAFDVATSCLAVQDMPDIPRVLRSIRDALVPLGRLVMSIAHPCTDTPFRRWQKDAAGNKQWLCVDRYFDRGAVTYAWKGWRYDFSTTAYHATLEDWFAWIAGAGFSIRALREPAPSAATVAAQPELMDATRIPFFLLIDAVRS
jgi:SAM-dependent methyltransferase